MGGTDAAHRPQDCYDRPRRRRTAAAGPGGAAEIPGRPDLAAAAAEQLDHRHHRRHCGRCAGPHLDQPAPKLARCPGKARVDGRGGRRRSTARAVHPARVRDRVPSAARPTTNKELARNHIMTETNEKAIKVLNNLIETNLDRIKGYETAAEDSDDAEIKNLCNSYASQSRGFKVALESLVKELGGEPKESSSGLGAVYRAWMKIKHSASDSKKSVLSSCEFGEDAAVKSYQEVLEETNDLPQNVVALIQSQNNEIVRAHDKIKSMRDAVAAR
jgi:uncharacterized protein (TIGR02284 family)